MGSGGSLGKRIYKVSCQNGERRDEVALLLSSCFLMHHFPQFDKVESKDVFEDLAMQAHFQSVVEVEAKNVQRDFCKLLMFETK
jgi:hypothetical protein